MDDKPSRKIYFVAIIPPFPAIKRRGFAFVSGTSVG
jgi:hypothetical protein